MMENEDKERTDFVNKTTKMVKLICKRIETAQS